MFGDYGRANESVGPLYIFPLSDCVDPALDVYIYEMSREFESLLT